MTQISADVTVIAPMLRILLGRNGRLPVVRLIEEAGAGDADLHIDAESIRTSEQLAECLAATPASGSLESVRIDDVGFFKIINPAMSAGRVAGRIALVTGAAQGFGLEIARDLAAQGAWVCLADINQAGATDAARAICRQYGAGRATAAVMNVVDGVSIRAALRHVVSWYGGLDVLVANAGVLKAGSVKTQPEQDFDFVTSVNYKGFFLCTQAAAPIMAAQHAVDKAYMGDIIQINSKSGLQGSNKNGAYAGGKFGAIGLVQSFAMELIEDGIKVNAICPGNFFDGPLWSDPDTGLFVQYLRTGKIPGARTVADVKRAYEQKVPMQRGCTTADVMKALYYIIEQRYETGQAVPVTGGQVMLH